MVAPHQVQLDYSVTPVSTVSTGALTTAMQNVVLYASPTQDPVLCQALGLTVESDTTALDINGNVTRTLILNMDFVAGVPLAPPYFVIHNQNQDGLAAVYSSSDADNATGDGAQQVSIIYENLAEVQHTVLVNLEGRKPVPLPVVFGVKVASIVTMSITRTGSLGNSFGQITVAVFDPSAKSLQNLNGAPTRDDLMGALGDHLGYLPPSYYSYATSGPGLGFNFDTLKAMLRNIFTATLSKALAAQVVAADPVLIP
jgi:hypothetical protein